MSLRSCTCRNALGVVGDLEIRLRVPRVASRVFGEAGYHDVFCIYTYPTA